MSVEIFNTAQFEQALTLSNRAFHSIGMVQGELCYSIPLDTKVAIEIRSTITHQGTSSDAGQDSIRLWLTESASGKPLGKLDKWTQRVAGWETRLLSKINQLVELRTLAGDCPNCGDAAAVWISHSEKNDGKLYAKCMRESKWLKWVNVKSDDVATDVKAVKVANKAAKKSALSALDAADETKQAPVIIKRTFVPSDKQVAIGDFVTSSDNNLRVEAVAGSGKTTTNVYVANRLPKGMTVKAMVFNKRNATDMQAKLPEFVEATTAHAAAFKDIRRVTPRVKVDDRKMWDLFNGYVHDLQYAGLENTAEEIRTSASDILRVVSLVKNTLSEPTDKNIELLCDHHGISFGSATSDSYKATRELYNRSQKQMGTVIDFDDMLAGPAQGKIMADNEPVTHDGRELSYRVNSCDLLFVDEAQDTNKAQQEYYLKAGKRIVFVGDKGQAIYGFRGADVDAMDNLHKALNAEQLPLSVCYRCDKSIIKLAQEIVPQIEAAPNAADGVVRTIDEGQLLQQVTPGNSMVLCRLNAPLVKPAFELIRNGVKAVILGKDIGKGLVTLIQRIQRKHGIDGAELNLVLVKLHDYVTTEAARLYLVRKDNQASMLEDQFETIIALADGCKTVRELQVRIEGDATRGIKGIFSDDVDGIPFASIHKAKGHEMQKVFILHPELLPFPKAKEPWQKVQEQNLKYVAITRAMNELVWVNP